MYKVDLNSDLGESFGAYTIGSDDRVLALVSSANVACGFHAGDPSVMGATVAACRAQGVAVGAHPGFPDLVGFGRRQLAVTPDQAYGDVLYQIGALAGFCRTKRRSLAACEAPRCFVQYGLQGFGTGAGGDPRCAGF